MNTRPAQAPVGTELDYFDAQGWPDLQRLVESFGGYDRITAEAWVQFDATIAAYHKRRRIIDNSVTGSVTASSVTEIRSRGRYSSFEECARCFARGIFGYRKQTLSRIGQLTPAATAEPGDLIWFCRRHMPARCFADARRDP